MIIIDNSQNISSTLIYGAHSVEEMTLKNMQTNEEFDIELFDTSQEERYGIFQFLYNENLPLNSGEVIDCTTNFNMVPGKYMYTMGDLIGILYFKTNKNNVIIYGQTSETTIYNG